MAKANFFNLYQAGKCLVGQTFAEQPPPLLTALMDSQHSGELRCMHQVGTALLLETGFSGFSVCFYDTTQSKIDPIIEVHSHEARWTPLARRQLCRDSDPAVCHAFQHVRSYIELGTPSESAAPLSLGLAANGVQTRVAVPCHGVSGKLTILFLYHETSMGLTQILGHLALANMSVVAMHEIFITKHRVTVQAQWQALTAREREVLSLAAEGLPTRKIAEAIKISENTVLKYMKQIFEKLGVHKRQHAISVALSNQLISVVH